MFAYRFNVANLPLISTFHGGELPEVEWQGHTYYFITLTKNGQDLVVDEETFHRLYMIRSVIDEMTGRYLVDEREDIE